jgi:hypothetical protein
MKRINQHASLSAIRNLREATEMQRLVVSGIILCWGLVSYGLIALITGYQDGMVYLWGLVLLSPFSLRVVNWMQRRLINQPCILSYHKRSSRIFVHLSPNQPTVSISSERVAWFWNGVLTSIEDALSGRENTIVIASHLLTSYRIKRIRRHLQIQAGHYRSHVIHVPFTPAARAVMQLEILLAQWRWRVPSRTLWPVLVIRKTFNPEK